MNSSLPLFVRMACVPFSIEDMALFLCGEDEDRKADVLWILRAKIEGRIGDLFDRNDLVGQIHEHFGAILGRIEQLEMMNCTRTLH
jgi:hypothetical protein